MDYHLFRKIDFCGCIQVKSKRFYHSFISYCTYVLNSNLMVAFCGPVIIVEFWQERQVYVFESRFYISFSNQLIVVTKFYHLAACENGCSLSGMVTLFRVEQPA